MRPPPSAKAISLHLVPEATLGVLSDAAIERWSELLSEHPEVMGLLIGLKFPLLLYTELRVSALCLVHNLLSV